MSEPSPTMAHLVRRMERPSQRASRAVQRSRHESARIVRSISMNDIEIGAGSNLEECIVTDGVRVPRARPIVVRSRSRQRHHRGDLVRRHLRYRHEPTDEEGLRCEHASTAISRPSGR